MAEFTVNPTRFDPYKNMKFHIKWDGKYIPGVSKISPPFTWHSSEHPTPKRRIDYNRASGSSYTLHNIKSAYVTIIKI